MTKGVWILAVFLLMVIGINFYLAPDDLRGCGDTPRRCPSADAIVAVSGGDTVARTAEAISLYQNDWAPLLIFAGAAKDKTGPSNAEVMKRQAVASGVPANAILTEETSVNTSENADNVKRIIDDRGIGSVIVVTSAYHQRRAGLEFGRAAGESVKVFNKPVQSDQQWSPLWWATPTGWYLAVGELIKIAMFYLTGAVV